VRLPPLTCNCAPTWRKLPRRCPKEISPLPLRNCVALWRLIRIRWRLFLFATLEHDYGVDLAYADEEVDATAAEANVAELLGVPRGASVLRIRQVIYSSKGKATIYGVGFYRSERHTLFIRRFR
jgi:hypothetical protein